MRSLLVAVSVSSLLASVGCSALFGVDLDDGKRQKEPATSEAEAAPEDDGDAATPSTPSASASASADGGAAPNGAPGASGGSAPPAVAADAGSTCPLVLESHGKNGHPAATNGALTLACTDLLDCDAWFVLPTSGGTLDVSVTAAIPVQGFGGVANASVDVRCAGGPTVVSVQARLDEQGRLQVSDGSFGAPKLADATRPVTFRAIATPGSGVNLTLSQGGKALVASVSGTCVPSAVAFFLGAGGALYTLTLDDLSVAGVCHDDFSTPRTW